MLDRPLVNAVPRHIQPEKFQVYASAELLAAPPWRAGVCFLPQCSRSFEPSRPWQIYCCGECERIGTAELRRWGHRMALPLLAWRMGKYEQHDEGVRDLSRAARRYVSHVQSLWIEDRAHRRAASVGGDDGV